MAGTAITTVTVLGTGGVAGALLKVEVPAPVSEATGAAADVLGVVGIGKTQTVTGPAGGQARANAIEIGGQPPTALVGGTQTGPGQKSGALLDTTQTALGRVEVAPWSASVSEDERRSQAEAMAALLRANLFDPEFASLDLLQSMSASSWEELISRSRSSSDAAVLKLGGDDGLVIKVLHSETSSEAGGVTYLISINGRPALSVDELGRQVCALDVTGVLELSCLTVAGGVGSTIAQVLGLTLVGLPTEAVTAAGSGGPAQVTELSVPPAPVPEVKGGVVTADPASSGGGTLPVTGATLALYATAAAALMAMGTVLVRLRRALQVARP